jgi:hypothetical protein
MAKRRSTRLKRVVLGEGYPNFSGNGDFPTTVTLKPRSHATLHFAVGDDRRLKTVPWGAKVRLVAEVIG